MSIEGGAHDDRNGAAMLAETAASVLGIDLDPAAVEHATMYHGRPNTQFRVGNAEHLELTPNSLDLVVSFGTIEHIEEQETFLGIVAQALTPDGFLST